MLLQAEADALLAAPKHFVDGSTIEFPPGGHEIRELMDAAERDLFHFDLRRGSIRISKLTYQTRARRSIILARLDIDGSPHTNPDGNKVGGPHLHIYREDYEDKWAAPVDPSVFKDPSDIGQAFVDFCGFCRIESPPPLQAGGW